MGNVDQNGWAGGTVVGGVVVIVVTCVVIVGVVGVVLIFEVRFAFVVVTFPLSPLVVLNGDIVGTVVGLGVVTEELPPPPPPPPPPPLPPPVEVK